VFLLPLIEGLGNGFAIMGLGLHHGLKVAPVVKFFLYFLHPLHVI
jgi:hypothetical protein